MEVMSTAKMRIDKRARIGRRKVGGLMKNKHLEVNGAFVLWPWDAI
jgi:hypothetical protein